MLIVDSSLVLLTVHFNWYVSFLDEGFGQKPLSANPPFALCLLNAGSGSACDLN